MICVCVDCNRVHCRWLINVHFTQLGLFLLDLWCFCAEDSTQHDRCCCLPFQAGCWLSWHPSWSGLWLYFAIFRAGQWPWCHRTTCLLVPFLFSFTTWSVTLLWITLCRQICALLPISTLIILWLVLCVLLDLILLTCERGHDLSIDDWAYNEVDNDDEDLDQPTQIRKVDQKAFSLASVESCFLSLRKVHTQEDLLFEWRIDIDITPVVGLSKVLEEAYLLGWPEHLEWFVIELDSALRVEVIDYLCVVPLQEKVSIVISSVFDRVFCIHLREVDVARQHDELYFTLTELFRYLWLVITLLALCQICLVAALYRDLDIPVLLCSKVALNRQGSRVRADITPGGRKPHIVIVRFEIWINCIVFIQFLVTSIKKITLHHFDGFVFFESVTTVPFIGWPRYFVYFDWTKLGINVTNGELVMQVCLQIDRFDAWVM